MTTDNDTATPDEDPAVTVTPAPTPAPTNPVPEYVVPVDTGPSLNTRLHQMLWGGMVFTELPRGQGFTLAMTDKTKTIASQDFRGVIEAAYAFYTEAIAPTPTPAPTPMNVVLTIGDPPAMTHTSGDDGFYEQPLPPTEMT